MNAAHEPQVKALLAAQPALAARLDAAQTQSSSGGRGKASGAASSAIGAGGVAASGAGEGSDKKPLIALKMNFGHFKS